jgi:hypothetical protein
MKEVANMAVKLGDKKPAPKSSVKKPASKSRKGGKSSGNK